MSRQASTLEPAPSNLKDGRFPSAADIARTRRQPTAPIPPLLLSPLRPGDLEELLQTCLPATCKARTRDDWETIFRHSAILYSDPRLADLFSTETLDDEDLCLFLLGEDQPDDADPQTELLRMFLKDAVLYLPEYMQATPGQMHSYYPYPPRYRGHSELWRNHQVWFGNDPTPYTIAEQQYRVLKPKDMPASLRVSIPVSVQQKRPDMSYRRLSYFSSPDGSAFLTIMREATLTQVPAINSLLRGYLNPYPRCRYDVIVTENAMVTFILDLPYLTMTTEKREDTREVCGRRLRLTQDITYLYSLDPYSQVKDDESGLFMCEAQLSGAVNVIHKHRWEALVVHDEHQLADSRQPEFEGLPIPEDAQGSFVKVPTNLTDPILKDEISRGPSESRIYYLKMCHKNLYTVLKHQRALCVRFRWSIKSTRLSLPLDINTIHARHESVEKMEKKINHAARDANSLATTVREQVLALERFLSDHLKPSTVGSGGPRFKGPFFKSLHGPKAPEEDKKCAQKAYAGIVACMEDFKTMVQDLEQILEDCEVIRKELRKVEEKERRIVRESVEARNHRINISQYLAHSLTIPLAIFQIPPQITRIPESSGILAILTIGLTGLFMLLPYALQVAAIVLPLLWRYATDH